MSAEQSMKTNCCRRRRTAYHSRVHQIGSSSVLSADEFADAFVRVNTGLGLLTFTGEDCTL